MTSRSASKAISLSGADITPSDAALVHEVLLSPQLSDGQALAAFEHEWSLRFGSRHVVGVSSGTSALHLAMLAAGVTANDAVITTPFSFIASANCILYEGGLPVFVDIDPRTLTIDPALAAEAADDLAAGGAAARRWLPPSHRQAEWAGGMKALLPVHVFGHPADMAPLLETGRRHHVPVIEDACEAIGARYGGRSVGTIGQAAAFGFYPNKQMTTGEGGLFVTDDETWAAMARSLRNQGRDTRSVWLEHNRLGFNYRLDEMSAALGLGQLRRIDAILDARRKVAAMYHERLSGCSWLQLPTDSDDMSWFVYVVRVRAPRDRDAIIELLADQGIPSRAYFPPIHLQPYYRERFGYTAGSFPHAEQAGRDTLALPFHTRLTADEVDYVCGALLSA